MTEFAKPDFQHFVGAMLIHLSSLTFDLFAHRIAVYLLSSTNPHSKFLYLLSYRLQLLLYHIHFVVPISIHHLIELVAPKINHEIL